MANARDTRRRRSVYFFICIDIKPLTSFDFQNMTVSFEVSSSVDDFKSSFEFLAWSFQVRVVMQRRLLIYTHISMTYRWIPS
jgi:hypothetical protein